MKAAETSEGEAFAQKGWKLTQGEAFAQKVWKLSQEDGH